MSSEVVLFELHPYVYMKEVVFSDEAHTLLYYRGGRDIKDRLEAITTVPGLRFELVAVQGVSGVEYQAVRVHAPVGEYRKFSSELSRLNYSFREPQVVNPYQLIEVLQLLKEKWITEEEVVRVLSKPRDYRLFHIVKGRRELEQSDDQLYLGGGRLEDVTGYEYHFTFGGIRYGVRCDVGESLSFNIHQQCITAVGGEALLKHTTMEVEEGVLLVKVVGHEFRQAPTLIETPREYIVSRQEHFTGTYQEGADVDVTSEAAMYRSVETVHFHDLRNTNLPDTIMGIEDDLTEVDTRWGRYLVIPRSQSVQRIKS